MIRVGLAQGDASYAGLVAPYGPGEAYPELPRLFLGSAPAPERPNPVYDAVRRALVALGLDQERAGQPDWNPLGDLVSPGGTVVLKPNWIRHWNPAEREGRAGTLESVITHGSVLRAVADYAFLAVGTEGTVTIAEAPQQDCDIDAVRAAVGVEALIAFYRKRAGRELRVIDLRREAVRFEGGVIAERRPLPGDPAGYREVDLGERSFFTGSGRDPARFRGADYDPGPTTEHHSNGRNAYLLSETVLSADLIVNLPKLKTHKKTGVTLALKNLVGINGDKNWLPHHSVGSPADGGDEFPESRQIDRWRSMATEWVRPLLARGRLGGLVRAVRRVEDATRGSDFIRSGNWHGNDTTWRMCCDLNRCVYYSDAAGLHLEAAEPVRQVLTVIDGVVAGEGNGPLAPTDVPLGAVIAALDPVAADLVALALMGYRPDAIRKISEPMRDPGPRITKVRTPDDVAVFEVVDGSLDTREAPLATYDSARSFEPHPGWLGRLERSAT